MSAAIRRALRAAARTMSTRALATSSLVPFPAPRVTVAYTPKAIDAEIRRVFFSGDADTETSPSSSLRLIGFDIEHKPETRKGAAPSVHLVQITSPGGDECLLLHVAAAGLSAMTEPRARREVPHLVRLLGDARVVAAGVGVGGDLDRLRRSHATLFCSGAFNPNTATPASSVRTLDSQAVHLFYHPEAAGASVARLAAEHALATSAQSKSVTMSDWSLAPLAPRQVAYAAEDASLSFRIAQRQFERYAPKGATFTEWAACFLGVDTPLAMDARVAEILKNPVSKKKIPEAMLAAFRRHHSAMTRLRRLRANASRWRAMTVALAKHAANAPGFASAVSTLDVLRAAVGGGGADKPADEGDEGESVSDARMRVRYEHSRLDVDVCAPKSEDALPRTSPTFACAATAELRIPRETVSDGDPGLRSEREGSREVTLVFEGRGRSKRAAKDAAARGVLAAVRLELDGVWMCSNAAKWAAEPNGPESPNDEAGAAAKELARRLTTRTPLRCALGCGGAGAALAGPRDRTRVGVAQPAHFEDEAGWASCALRRRRRERI